ncbi:MAG: LytTR family DNA-binding domain-containing protein [Verrucomicrobiales bacterium]|nr:LytTR family DNA-binding domain-containing protein [Verrucomicrobiales bacterium]
MSAKTIRTFLVDDEPLARDRMRQLLQGEADLEIVGEYGNGTDCIEAALESPPDLIFLDIGLPDHNGLEVVSELAGEMESLPLVVFATAYDEHAIAAFELNALDYLLKPISRDRLTLTLERVRSAFANQDRSEEDQKLRSWIDSEGKAGGKSYLSRIEIRERQETHFVPLDQVHFFQSDKNYIETHTAERVYLSRMTMARLEPQLDPECFVRISRSVMVSVSHVASIEKKRRNEYWVRLDTGERVGASRNLDLLEKKLAEL